MNLNFKPVEAEDLEKLNPFFCKRPNKTCDSVFLDSFIWREYYNVRYAVSDNKAILWLMDLDGKTGSAMPICSEEDLEYYFWKLVEYFNTELKAPLYINLADEEAVEQLGLKNMPDKFKITEQVDLKDYLYDGNAMRALSGKKLHKKKNHLNAFKREYEGRYEYRRLCCSDRGDVWKFLDRWREEKGEEVEEHLDYEVRGIHEILKNCSLLNVRMSGVYIDGHLEAFTIGSYNPLEQMAVIHRASMGMYLLCKAIHEQTDVRVLLTGEISDELFGYKYTDYAPTADAFQQESQKRIRELYMYDVLRADRCISSNSIEARVPFGDLDFVRYVMAIDPEKKLNRYGKGKYLLRKAFEGDWLPPEILWREKAAFSDAVGHSMVDDIKEYAESLYTDEEFQMRRANYSAHCMPFTKESLFYREIFEKYYHDQSRTIVGFWMPNKAWPGCNVNDPSARVLANYGASGV